MAADLSPMEAAALDPARVTAVVTAFGSPVSHGAILARSLGIPMVVAPEPTALAVDRRDDRRRRRHGGCRAVRPGAATPCATTSSGPPPRAVATRRCSEAADPPAVTTDGVHVEVAANIASADDVAAAIRHGADSVGLLRTEFLFLDRHEPARRGRTGSPATCPSPTPSAAAGSPSGRSTSAATSTSRTSPATPKPTRSSAAAASASASNSPSCSNSSCAPSSASVSSTRSACCSRWSAPSTSCGQPNGCSRTPRPRSVAGRGELPPGFEVGVMVEVPALALHARAAAALVDLFSIGTNDLTQYTLAAERGNAAVARLADPLDPAVLRLIAAITDAAGATTRVAVCGEIAADPDAAAVLIGLGVDELSMAATDDPRRQTRHPLAVPRQRARPRSPGARARVGGRRPRPHGVKAERSKRSTVANRRPGPVWSRAARRSVTPTRGVTEPMTAAADLGETAR